MSGPNVLVLTGGIGGAKLCLGLQRILPSDALTIAVNTGDDFTHLGLRICPDIDTTLYTLAGLADPERGWGRHDETWTFMRTLGTLGGETWFQLGDGDLALHVERSRRLAAGESLSHITLDVAQRFGIHPRVLPASDDAIATMVMTNEGELGFQEYFVRRRCEPAVRSLAYRDIERAQPSSLLLKHLSSPGLHAILIAPSNPFLSIAPILNIPGMREALKASAAPVIAITPIIGDAAVKGPTAKIMRELALRPSALTIAEHYADVIDGFVLDERDASLAPQFTVPVLTCDTWMRSLEDRERVAHAAVNFAQALIRSR